MTLGTLGLAALGVYLVALLVLAELARRARRDHTPSDHFLAGRELGAFVLFLTLYATAYSGNSLLGYPGAAYRRGYSFVMSTGFMMAIIVVFHALVPKLRPLSVRHAFVTPCDYVRLRFEGERGARALALAIGALMAVALANFLLAQLKAMGEVAAIVTDGAIPYAWGVAGLALLILFYETRGGMRAVAWTDAAQGVLMFVGLGALLAWLLGDAGGLASVTRDVARVRPQAVLVPSATTQANWFSTIGLLGIGSVLYPQAIQRIYAARSGAALRASFALMTFMPLATTLVVTLIGIAAIARLEGVPDVDADQVMPLVLGHWAEAGPAAMAGAVAVFLGALAAIMSTADSCLLSLGAVVARDLLGGEGADARTTRVGKAIAAAVLVAMVPLALDRDTTLWRLIELKMELLVQCAPAFLLGLHWRGLRAAPALAGVAAGTVFAVGLTLAGVALVGGVHVGMIGLALNAAIAVAGSAAGAPRALAARA
ncbi:MAG: sodium:solute symporter family protein [Myxococcota bacterium]|nr:sodium:solute symporter family protein [Myxococcales bacterium]